MHGFPVIRCRSVGRWTKLSRGCVDRPADGGCQWTYSQGIRKIWLAQSSGKSSEAPGENPSHLSEMGIKVLSKHLIAILKHIVVLFSLSCVRVCVWHI